ncbi:CPXCG motif-containing cysteine-rich protein [Luteimonas aquatica]|uniref:CPXCG motif-containing cysteine-rich protein n=1 Tax=Luteimonas aquatica TaxID=450364 RepID=UPI001F583DB0|nr:CPXCG motif-containing cysteine-rich protein [Luteimonas aquatica]
MLPSVEVQCPYCGEWIALLVDDSAGVQDYIEDCQVCCRPMRIAVATAADGGIEVSARSEDDA